MALLEKVLLHYSWHECLTRITFIIQGNSKVWIQPVQFLTDEDKEMNLKTHF